MGVGKEKKGPERVTRIGLGSMRRLSSPTVPRMLLRLRMCVYVAAFFPWTLSNDNATWAKSVSGSSRQGSVPTREASVSS